MIKEKKCQGQGIAKGFESCGKMVQVQYRIYGLGKMCCYPKWLMTTDNGKLKLSKALNQVQKPRKDLEEVQRQEKERTALKKAHATTKQVVHELVRERDKGKPCISCGNEWKPNFQAGHGYKAETYETLKYNLHNINGQCEQCNLRKDGDFAGYSLNLPDRIGIENYNELVRLAGIDKQRQKVWNVENLKEIREQIKKLKKG